MTARTRVMCSHRLGARHLDKDFCGARCTGGLIPTPWPAAAHLEQPRARQQGAAEQPRAVPNRRARTPPSPDQVTHRATDTDTDTGRTRMRTRMRTRAQTRTRTPHDTQVGYQPTDTTPRRGSPHEPRHHDGRRTVDPAPREEPGPAPSQGRARARTRVPMRGRADHALCNPATTTPPPRAPTRGGDHPTAPPHGKQGRPPSPHRQHSTPRHRYAAQHSLTQHAGQHQRPAPTPTRPSRPPSRSPSTHVNQGQPPHR